MSPPRAETTQGMMRDLFAESVVRKPTQNIATHNVASSRISHEDSMAASSLGADFEYEKAMRIPKSETARSRPINKRPSNSSVGRTESYRQAHNSGPGPAPAPPPSEKKLTNYNSLPRIGSKQKQAAKQQKQQPESDEHENYDSRSLGDRPRSRNAKVEDPCTVM